MATLVFFHAHPDDESIATAGTMALAADAGHRVVLVVATRGELGGFGHELLDDGETMADRRVKETYDSATILGAARVEFLDYLDSGMAGTPENDHPGSFWQAGIDEAATSLALILREEVADVLTVYDDHGGYGHPDHIQVHRVGHRAAELANTPRVYEATINRDKVRMLRATAPDDPAIANLEAVEEMGTPQADITTFIDVESVIHLKRASMAAHASQISEEMFFLAMPPEVFRVVFGEEVYLRVDAEPGLRETSLLAGLE